MRAKLSKFNLRMATAIMLAMCVAAILLGEFLPVGPTARLDEHAAYRSATSTPATTQSDDAENIFADLMDVNLRRPLVDARAANPASYPDETLGLRLTGTIIEPMRRYAVFTNASGKSELKSVGDKAGGADVTDIDSDSVTLHLPGRSMVLHAVKPSVIGGPGL